MSVSTGKLILSEKTILPLTLTPWNLKTIVPGKLCFCKWTLPNFLHFLLQFQLWNGTFKIVMTLWIIQLEYHDITN